MTRVLSFGFGKSQTTAGYPTVFIAGKVKGVYGVWRSSDDGKDDTTAIQAVVNAISSQVVGVLFPAGGVGL